MPETNNDKLATVLNDLRITLLAIKDGNDNYMELLDDSLDMVSEAESLIE